MAVLRWAAAALAACLVCGVRAGAQAPVPSTSPVQPPGSSPSAMQSTLRAASPLAVQSAQPPEQFVLGQARAHRSIATQVPTAQAAFDRGLVMLYAFNIGEARSAFRLAEAADPHAVVAYFGEAVAETVDINRPTTVDGERRGVDAVKRGRHALSVATSADERALLATAALRFDESKSQQQRFAAYAQALQSYADQYPSDGMGLTLAAYAGWNATGVLTQGAGDDLTADARGIAGDLEAALKLDPNDLGAHHLRIHFWEQAHHPERARGDADELAALAYDPGESHLEHMAGHIYDRLGEYTQMVGVNKGACANDEAYFKLGDGDGQKYMHSYHAHDVDFVLYGLTTVGRNAEAREFAARDSDYSREVVALRTHDDRAVLRLLGDAITPMRVIAEARLGDLERARKDIADLPHGKGAPAGETDYNVALAMISRASHDDHAALDAYERARSASGDDLGDPKTRWSTPIAEGLGATLLEARQPREAERVFAAELARYPNDPRLEYGLAQALRAQGKDDTSAHAAYLSHWQGPTPLTLSDLG